MRHAHVVPSLLLLAGIAALGNPADSARAAPPSEAGPAGPTIADHENLERNLRFMLARERVKAAKAPVVGVYADLGAWHPSVRSSIEALEKAGVPCRALDRSQMTAEGLAGLHALVLPGGWAPYQRDSIGTAGLAAIRAFVERGGRCLGICAGAFLLAKDVRWEGTSYPYPLGLYEGTAEGPVEGFAPFPQPSAARLTVTAPGAERGLRGLATTEVLYEGGPRFRGDGAAVELAKWKDGTAAIVMRRVGKGEVILSGAHLERPAPLGAGDDAPPPAAAGAWLRSLLGIGG